MPTALPPDVPSIFTRLRQPDAPPVDLAQPKPLAAERDAVRSLARTVEYGGAGSFLKDVLGDAHALAVKQRKNLERRKREKGEVQDDPIEDEAAELAERGFVHKRRPRSASEAADQEEEGGEVEDKATRAERAQKRGVRRAKRIRAQLVQPEVELDEVVLPDDFPSHDLLTSIHSHASNLLTSHHHLIPPLTSASPRLPPGVIEHFDALAARAADQEQYIARKGTVAQLRAVQQTRIRERGAGRRKALWADADRAFEGTALVALGVLAQLLVQDAVASPGNLPLPPA